MTKIKESKIMALRPHKGDVVNIKFKSINEIMKESKSYFHDTEETYNIAENLKAYLSGGHFLVCEVDCGADDNDDDDDTCISVINHLDCNSSFEVHDFVIDSIEIVNDSEKWISEDHRLMVVRIDNELFINGKPLIWNEKEERKEHENKITRTGYKKEEYENHNRKLLKLLENYIADLAVKETFEQGEQS